MSSSTSVVSFRLRFNILDMLLGHVVSKEGIVVDVMGKELFLRTKLTSLGVYDSLVTNKTIKRNPSLNIHYPMRNQVFFNLTLGPMLVVAV